MTASICMTSSDGETCAMEEEEEEEEEVERRPHIMNAVHPTRSRHAAESVAQVVRQRRATQPLS